MDKIAEALINQMQVSKFGLRPYDPARDVAKDVGFGGPSTEYLATAQDPYGAAFNYPTIWYDMYGNAQVLDPQQAYDQSINYEQAAGIGFPRYKTIGNAVTAAENRSAMGGGDVGALGSVFGFTNW